MNDSPIARAQKGYALETCRGNHVVETTSLPSTVV